MASKKTGKSSTTTQKDSGKQKNDAKHLKADASLKEKAKLTKTDQIKTQGDMPVKPSSLKSTKTSSVKPAKKNSKTKKNNELDEDLLLGEEIGNEDIPDLSDFDEDKEEAEVDLESDVDDGDELTVEEALRITAGELKPKSDDDEIILTDAEGRRLCRVRDCDQVAIVETWCRYHYLLNWKRIQAKRVILQDGKLERYVEELTSRYPDKFLEILRKDLRTEKDFMSAIAELEIDESSLDNEFEDEAQNYIDEVRGVTDTGISDEEEF